MTGSGVFWRRFELSLLSKEQVDELYEDGFIEEDELNRWSFFYVWTLMIYCAVLVTAGNDLLPMQPNEKLYVLSANIIGLIFITYLIGEVAVVISHITIQSTFY